MGALTHPSSTAAAITVTAAAGSPSSNMVARGSLTHPRALLVSSHVMDEARRCERILLLREGMLVADDSPDAIRARADTEDLDEAFLRLVEAQAVA